LYDECNNCDELRGYVVDRISFCSLKNVKNPYSIGPDKWQETL